MISHYSYMHVVMFEDFIYVGKFYLCCKKLFIHSMYIVMSYNCMYQITMVTHPRCFFQFVFIMFSIVVQAKQ